MHGNVIGMTDSDGVKTADKLDYTAFGINTDDIPSPFGYCGEYYDEETGLIYLRNRYYDSTTGRFITEDPVKSGLHWYNYCKGNPIFFADPMGLSDIPGWLDWDDDGRIDTNEDRERFDANKNGVADWNEKGGTVKEWYQLRHSKILDVPFVKQNNDNLCWAASMAMVIEYLTKKPINFIRIAKDIYGEEGYNRSRPIRSIPKAFMEQGYLYGSGYEVDDNIYNAGLPDENGVRHGGNRMTMQDIVACIDRGIPLIAEAEKGHAEVIIGYAYDDEIDKQFIMLNDPATYKVMFEFEAIKNVCAISFNYIGKEASQ